AIKPSAGYTKKDFPRFLALLHRRLNGPLTVIRATSMIAKNPVNRPPGPHPGDRGEPRPHLRAVGRVPDTAPVPVRHRPRRGSGATAWVTVAARKRRRPTPPPPNGADPVAAAAVLHTGATAHLGLFREAQLRLGETIVIGGVGGAALQSAGARVIAVARSDQTPWCRANRAQKVLDYRAPDLTGRLRDAAPGGIDVYWGTSGHHDLEQVVPLLAYRGRMITMAALDARPPLPVGALYTRDASLRGSRSPTPRPTNWTTSR
ncbi:zinc-binding dehydrogenase, partial [Streptomyces sp. NPDC001817]|uniref:zinc-binding dehydrogenase n=1 Tax=Streptomyces sp. NPDC001817 TaxID=3154398 RepID=UPI00332DF055